VAAGIVFWLLRVLSHREGSLKGIDRGDAQ
jgi:hypothetical protein